MKSRESNREEIGRLKTEIASIDDKLQGYRPIKDLQIERSKLTEENDILEIDKESFYSDRSSFIRHYTILLKLYPRIKKILNYINDKESNGELPPTIDIDLVRQLLDHLNEECPLCGNKIGESGKEHLEGLLDQYSVSSQTSNYLNTIKGPLESATEEVLEYKSKDSRQ
jgi:hypothetical protein